MTNKELFLKLIELERQRQNKKWPNQKQQNSVGIHEWCSILGEEYGEFLKEVNDKNNFNAIIELAETAAVCLRIAEIAFKNHTLEAAKSYMEDRTKNQKSASETPIPAFIDPTSLETEAYKLLDKANKKVNKLKEQYGTKLTDWFINK